MKAKEKKYAQLWAAAQLRKYSVGEILSRLERFRTFYTMAWEQSLSDGRIEDGAQFYRMISNITRLFVDINAEKSLPEMATAQAVMQVPLMLAPMESLDFAHLLDGGVDA